jgi:membrane-bound metal-dependent hydrolase YbcI (DUF457 family)
MRSWTHVAMGLYIFLMFERLTQPSSLIVVAILILIGSLLPDIDIGTSFLGKRFKLFGEIFDHRGFIHTIYMLFILTLLTYFLFNNVLYALAFFIAYAFHLLLDAFTPMGIKPFWFGPKINGFAKTGSVIDTFLFVFLIIISGLMLAKII